MTRIFQRLLRLAGTRRRKLLLLVMAGLGLLAAQAFEALLMIFGLGLKGAAAHLLLAVFGLFALPLPYASWLVFRSRQPSHLLSNLIVRPTFAWHSNWMYFLMLLVPLIILGRIGAHYFFNLDQTLAVLRWSTFAVTGPWMFMSMLGISRSRSLPVVETREVNIPGLDPAAEGLKIVQLSDPHVAWWNSRQKLRMIGEMIRALNPDLLVITGDMVDHLPKYINSLADCLDQVRPRLGRFAVIGNHDVYAGKEEIVRIMEESGFKMLRTEWVSLREKGVNLVLAGFDDPGAGGKKADESYDRMAAALITRPRELPVILLSHRPPPPAKIRELPAQLILSGHTHGGQIKFPFNGPAPTKIAYRQIEGIYKIHGKTLHVSRGTGTIGWLPFRLYCPAEISLLILRAKPSSN